LTREWLYWYDRNGNRYPTPEKLVQQQQQQLEQTQEQLEQTQEQFQALLAKLQQMGIEPNTL
jgi:DNA-binding protein H-NS